MHQVWRPQLAETSECVGAGVNDCVDFLFVDPASSYVSVYCWKVEGRVAIGGAHSGTAGEMTMLS